MSRRSPFTTTRTDAFPRGGFSTFGLLLLLHHTALRLLTFAGISCIGAAKRTKVGSEEFRL